MRRIQRSLMGIAALSAWMLAAPVAADTSATATTNDGCVRCHGNAEFMVTYPKLWSYFQDWKASIHGEEGVTCSDCHGGDPTAHDAKTAHGAGVGADSPSSGVHYTRVVETCGNCHDEVLAGFVNSKHYRHIRHAKNEAQGPTCVTCHGSINVDVLSVTSVEKACARCHNDETGNHPDIPLRAREVLRRFLSIHRYYRYLGRRLDPDEAKAFFEEIDERVERLNTTWHSFDLDAIEASTKDVMDTLRRKRRQLRGNAKSERR